MRKSNPLRKYGRRALVQVLEKSYFTRHNFDVTFDGLKTDADLAYVEFALNRDFYFKVSKNSSSRIDAPRYITEECPGEELTEAARYGRSDFSACLIAAREWIQRILQDYREASPLVDEFEEFRNSLMKDLTKHVNDPDAHFTKAEVEAMQAKLDGLAERFEELQKRNEINEEEVKRVKSQLEELKGDLKTFPKGAWYKTAGNKVLDLVVKFFGSKEGRELVVSTTRALVAGDSTKTS